MTEGCYLSYAQEIVFGARAMAHLDESVTRYGWQRVLLCATGPRCRECRR
jgi:hypothetical protein